MTWIKTIGLTEATGSLKRLYQRVKSPNGQVDNILMAHSLRPHSLNGHMHLYKNVLHHSSNMIPKWQLETVGVYVSMLNKCDYCINHHAAGLAKLTSQSQADEISKSLTTGEGSQYIDNRLVAILRYTKKLTLLPSSITETDLVDLRASDLTDGEILEINQVAAYFSYANRTVLGLGVTIDGEELGEAPSSSDGNNWNHE